MFYFQTFEKVPQLHSQRSLHHGFGGLVEVEGTIVWSGGKDAYRLDKKNSKWITFADSSKTEMTLAVCRGRLIALGGYDNGMHSKKVMVFREGRWSLMSEMLLGCTGPCVVSIGGGGMVVMGGIGDGDKPLRDVQVFVGRTQTWHKGPSLPQPCRGMSAVVHGDIVYVMGGWGMDRAVWCANIRYLLSTWRTLPDVPYYYSSVCVVEGVLLAIGGAEDKDGSKKTATIYGFRQDDNRWEHIGDLPFACCWVDTLLLSGGGMLVVDGHSQQVLRIAVEGLAKLFPTMPSLKEADGSGVSKQDPSTAAVMSDTSIPHTPSYAPFEPICEEHICPVTKGLLVDPYQTSCCGHYLSKEAVDGLLAQDARCPMCRAPFSCKSDKAFKRRVHQELKVRCLSHSDCNWCGTYSDFLQHCGIRINDKHDVKGTTPAIVNKNVIEMPIHNFNSYLKERKYYESPSFYTHQKGYKMLIRVYPYGYDECEGTHLCAVTFLMTGDNDNRLQFPFRGSITLQILNQMSNGEEGNYERTFEYNDKTDDIMCKRVPESESMNSGMAMYNFIPLDELQNNNKYLKHDCLQFRVAKIVVRSCSEEQLQYDGIKSLTAPDLCSIPDPPSEVTAQPTGSKSIKVSWTLPQNISKCGAIQGYELSYSTSKSSTSVLKVDVTTFAEITGLKPYTTYNISVRARAAEAYSEYSSPCTATSNEDVPSVPIEIVADGITATSMTLSWQPPQDANGIIRNYQVSYTPHDGSECIHDMAGDITSTELTSLKPRTEYTIRVRAKTVEFGEYSSFITKKTLPDEIPPPIELKADGVTSTSVTISWQPPNYSNSIREYQVSYIMTSGSEHLHEVQDAISTELTSLQPHTEYTIRVRAKTVEFGEYSIPITIHTLELISDKLPAILDKYKDVTFKQLRIVKLIFYGAPRAGKTTLRKQLLRLVKDEELQPCGNSQPSTNLAEMCDRIFVQRIVVTNEQNDEWKWNVQTLDDIAKALLRCLENKHLQNENIINTSDTVSTSIIENPIKQKKYVEQRNLSEESQDLGQDKASQVLKQELSKPIHPTKHIETNQQQRTLPSLDIKEYFGLDAIKTGNWADVVSALNIDKAVFLQTIDGGGQPSFQEIFPLLISGPSVTLVVFKLTDDLEKLHQVQYQPDEGTGESKAWKDYYIVKDIISHALASFAVSQNETTALSRHNTKTPFSCNLLLVGTHKDELEVSQDPHEDKESCKQAKIEYIATQLQGWLDQSTAFRCIEVRCDKDIITGIDNSSEQDIVTVKKKIEHLISQLEYRNIPAPWLVFDFVLRKHAESNHLRKLGTDVCKKLAAICSVPDDEFDMVLHYLHFEAGTLLYYSDIPELNQYVITDFQLIFDSISKIIIEFFDDDSTNGPHKTDKNLLRRKGQLNALVLKNVEGCLEVDELLSLLQHRHVISEMETTDMFFMPSVLPKDNLSYNKLSDPSSFLVLFDHSFCPVGLFCAATTRLIVKHKWKLNEVDQYRNKINFYCTFSGKSYNVIFSAFSAHYEVYLKSEALPGVKYMIYQNINDVFTKVCEDMKYSSPSYGFYCPKKCEYYGIDYHEYKHPAICEFKSECQMECYYTKKPSDLTEEHKQWFTSLQMGSPEQIKVPSPQSEMSCQVVSTLKGQLTVKLLTCFPSVVDGEKKTINIIQRTGTSYEKLGMFLLEDDNGDIVDSLKEPCHHDPIQITTAIYKKWITGTGRKPVTWQTLVDALREIDLNRVADDIDSTVNHHANGYGSSTSSTCNLMNLMNDVASKIPTKWRSVGFQLGLSSRILDSIQSNNAGKPDASLVSFEQVFTTWEQQGCSPFTWNTIIEALRKPAVGEVALAGELEVQHNDMKSILSNTTPPMTHSSHLSPTDSSTIERNCTWL